MFDNFFVKLLFALPGIIVAFSMHEFAHAIVAHKLGDPTPEREGRLTLSPLAHIDPMGLIFLIIVQFGWAKPVNIDTRYFRNPRRDNLLVSLAGPMMNLALSIVFLIVLSAMNLIGLESYVGSTIYKITSGILATAAWFNVLFMVFNLLPIAPLDGFRVLYLSLPRKYHHNIQFLEMYGPQILMGLILSSMVEFPKIAGATILDYLIHVPTGIILDVLRLIFLKG